MSGPVRAVDAAAVARCAEPARASLEVSSSRAARVGGLPVRRALPRPARRTVGAWCFIDHFGPADGRSTPLRVGPHPHLGLQTVTWLVEGEVLHRDSLGSEQRIRPGELNLMTAGRGIAHAEESTTTAPGLHGVQLWIAQPSATRNGPSSFEHHAELPRLEVPGGLVTVLVGSLHGATSPARCDSELVGVEVVFSGQSVELALPTQFESALVVLSGRVGIEATKIEPGALAYLGSGRERVVLHGSPGARALVVGGVPFGEPILMWWNFVGRDRDELSVAYAEWAARSSRFGEVVSALGRIEAPPPPWTRGLSR